MSFPTVLGPWYVVQRFDDAYCEGTCDSEYPTGVAVSYYTTSEEGTSTFRIDKNTALLFTNLQAAARIAANEGAQIRVLTSHEEAKEFGRG